MKRTTIILYLLLLFNTGSVFSQAERKGYFEFLQQIYFENTQHQYDTFLLDKMQSLQLHHLSPAEYEQVLWMISNLELNTGQSSSAFCHFFRLASLFPQSTFVQQSKHLLDSLSIVLALPETVPAYLKQIPFIPNLEEAFFNEISFLYSQNSDPLRSALLLEINDFLTHFPDSKFGDILLFWEGVLNEQLNAYHESEVLYRIVLQLYPNSPVSGQAELNLSFLYLNHLKKVRKARVHLLNIINTYSDKPIAGDAQFALARIYDDSLKNSEEALLYYQMYTKHFSDSAQVLYALRRSGELNESLQKWEEAALAFEKLYEYAPTDTLALHALKHLEEIYLTKLKAYEKAARILLIESRVLRDPQKLKQAAEIYKTYLHDPDKSQNILDNISKLFPVQD